MMSLPPTFHWPKKVTRQSPKSLRVRKYAPPQAVWGMKWIIAIQWSNLPQASTALSLLLHLTEMPQTHLFKSGPSFKTQFKCHLLHQTLLVMGQVWSILFSQYLYSSNIVYYTQNYITVICLCDIAYESFSILKRDYEQFIFFIMDIIQCF